MTRLGTGSKMKHLQAAELYLQEKVRTKELEVLKCSTLWNPADVLTKYVSEELMVKYLNLLGMVYWDDTETVSTIVEQKSEGKFSTNSMRTWFKRSMVIGMLATARAGDTCSSGQCDVQVHLKSNSQDSMMYMWVMLGVMLLCMILGCMCGWRLRGWWSGLGLPKKPVRNMLCQSQTRYARDRAEPRFLPLAEREHGAWQG